MRATLRRVQPERLPAVPFSDLSLRLDVRAQHIGPGHRGPVEQEQLAGLAGLVYLFEFDVGVAGIAPRAQEPHAFKKRAFGCAEIDDEPGPVFLAIVEFKDSGW